MALQDTRFDNPDDPEEKHIYIHFWQACAVFGAYILYVLVCANMDAIVAWFSDKRGLAALTSGSIVAAPTNYGTMEEDENINKRPLKSKHVKMEGLKDMPFLREHSQRSKEPPGNFQSVKFYRTLTGEKSEEHAMSDDLNKSNLSERSLLNTSQASLLERSIRSIRSRAFSDGNSLRKIDFILQYEKPSDEHDLHDIDVDTVGIRFDTFFGFLFFELSYLIDAFFSLCPSLIAMSTSLMGVYLVSCGNGLIFTTRLILPHTAGICVGLRFQQRAR